MGTRDTRTLEEHLGTRALEGHLGTRALRHSDTWALEVLYLAKSKSPSRTFFLEIAYTFCLIMVYPIVIRYFQALVQD